MVAFIFLLSVLDLKYFNKFKEHITEVPLNQKQGMLREKCPLHTFGELDFRVFCRCGCSLRGRTHHTPILSRPLRHLRVSTGSRQRWGRRLGAPSQDPRGRAPRDGTLFLPGRYPWKPASRWSQVATAACLPQSTGPKESRRRHCPWTGWGLRIPSTSSFIRAPSLRGAFCFSSGIVWERRERREGKTLPV